MRHCTLTVGGILLLATASLHAPPVSADNNNPSATSTTSSQQKENFDCHNLKGPNGEAVTPLKTALADPEQVKSCVMRGWDPPGTSGLPSTNWRANGGKNPGIKVGGSGGFTIGTTPGPGSPPGSRKAPASVSAAVIRTTCTFPPRVNISKSGISFPKGSCWDFFNEMLKDKDGATNKTPAPPPTNSSCPAESDTTGAYGTKSPVSGGASSTLPCGGMVPLSSAEVVLNASPVGFAVTTSGSYNISFYAKSGAGYAPVATAALPRFLCAPEPVGGESSTSQKSVDLTPPISQVITYSSTTGAIAVRLQSRAQMHMNYVPPYNPDEPEKYLIIPFDQTGLPEIPPDCAMDHLHFLEPNMRQDIVVQNTGEDCAPVGIQGTPVNNPTLECTGGQKPNANGKCLDTNGKEIPATVKDNWTYQCPSSTGAKVTVGAGGMCPQSQGYDAKGTCQNGKMEIPKPGGGKEVIACQPTSQIDACAANEAGSNNSCDTVQLSLEGQCQGKVQFGVLNTPNLYYPPGSTATLRPVSGSGMLMADTVAGSKYYARHQTNILLQETAPPLVFNEGGQVTFKNGSILIMEPPATIDVRNKRILLSNGGQLTTSGGTQEKGFGAGQVYTIPANMIGQSLLVNTGRSITLPAGYAVPTVPGSPYVRQPQPPLPQ